MNLGDWLKAFKALHQQAKRGALGPEDVRDYHAARDELARALLAAQHIAIEPGQQPRRALRANRALQADIAFFDGTVRATTRTISSGGFSALIARPPKVDDEVKVSLRLPGGEPLQLQAHVVGIKPQPGNAHVSFKWVGLAEEDAERLEIYVFDAVLEQLG